MNQTPKSRLTTSRAPYNRRYGAGLPIPGLSEVALGERQNLRGGDLEHDAASHAIVYAIVELAHVLGMTTVAEGVETAAQHRLLAAIGCDFCQGFYFAHPLATDALDALTDPEGERRLPALTITTATG